MLTGEVDGLELGTGGAVYHVQVQIKSESYGIAKCITNC